MIYTPAKHPKQAFTLITCIVMLGIGGTLLLNRYSWSGYFLIIALVFWIQYTAVLSYLQFKHKAKHTFKSITSTLLHPQIRFFIFIFLAVLGIGTYFLFRTPYIGIAALVIWWLFSLNFFLYYKAFRKHDKV